MQGAHHSHTRAAGPLLSTLRDSTQQGAAGLTTSKPGQCPEPASVALLGSFRSRTHHMSSQLLLKTPPSSLWLHPPFTNAFPDPSPPTGPHAQPGSVVGLPPASPRGAPVGAGHSLASAAAPHLQPCAGNGRFFVVREEWP